MQKTKFFLRALLPLILVWPAMSSADVLDDVLDRGLIRFGVAEYVPWTMKTKSGELIGYEIDVGKKIAADMNVQVQFEVYAWEDIIPALDRGEIDVIAGGMAITPSRALQVNFSRPLGVSGVSFATNTRKTRNITSMDQLNNERVIMTVVADTLAQSVAQTFFDKATIKVYSTTDEAEQDVIDGKAHAFLASVPEVNYLAWRNQKKVDVPVAEPLMASSEGLAVKKGEQALLNFLDAWVTARQTDKWLVSSREYWFETLEWMPDSGK
jgi:polar amino acid transport system substrate-binding protein